LGSILFLEYNVLSKQLLRSSFDLVTGDTAKVHRRCIEEGKGEAADALKRSYKLKPGIATAFRISFILRDI